ncbi:hypothetical protein DPMN_099571 [Dreissena polymorpha]|uniref:Uncharacterized protein n=1 Tax=Dreissena polymorpha TaxID=45954 RepID=A0A9D4LFR5_DREPO|nr:hypothetical protein DPMN_099571 [Dreissena polymorpha]
MSVVVYIPDIRLLSTNRHHLKWATDDQDHTYVSDEILWNKKLLTEALPLAFEKAIDTSISMAVTNGNKSPLVDGEHNLNETRNEETVAKKLDCTKLTLDEFMRKKLAVPEFDMSTKENKNVMIFFLNNIERLTALIDTVSEMRFLKDTAGRRVKPSQIFDPFDEFLCRLFYGEHVFPAAKDALLPHRAAFIKLGMKGVGNILPKNIYAVAKTIDSVSQIDDRMYDKAKALQEYIEDNPSILRQTLGTCHALYTAQQ